MIRISVVLPEPLGPRSPTIPASGSKADTLSSATMVPRGVGKLR